ncbi:MAG: hypothetical protein KF894_13110 [Labilithrix sp.]|nr:hypothetical protein [Labilithrix sp.]
MLRLTVSLLLGAALVACHYTPPETPFTERVAVTPIVVTGELTPGAKVTIDAVELEVLAVAGKRTDDELVAASVRGALDDVALAGALAARTAKVAAKSADAVARESDGRSDETAAAAGDVAKKADVVADVAATTAKVAALVSVLGALSASSEEEAEVVFRAVAEDRVYRATCASTDKRTMLSPEGRPSVSCAIVRATEHPERHWVLSVKMPGGALDALQLKGFVEARTAQGRDDSRPIFRVQSSDSSAPARLPSGEEGSRTLRAAFVSLSTWQAQVAAIELRSYGATPKAWIDRAAIADPEARDVVTIAAAVLSAFRWPELASEPR